MPPNLTGAGKPYTDFTAIGHSFYFQTWVSLASKSRNHLPNGVEIGHDLPIFQKSVQISRICVIGVPIAAGFGVVLGVRFCSDLLKNR